MSTVEVPEWSAGIGDVVPAAGLRPGMRVVDNFTAYAEVVAVKRVGAPVGLVSIGPIIAAEVSEWFEVSWRLASGRLERMVYADVEVFTPYLLGPARPSAFELWLRYVSPPCQEWSAAGTRAATGAVVLFAGG